MFALHNVAGCDEVVAFQNDARADGLGVGLQERLGDQLFHAGPHGVHLCVGFGYAHVLALGGDGVFGREDGTDRKKDGQHACGKREQCMTFH